MANAKDIARVFEYLSTKYLGKTIDKTSLNKLLYFAQGHTLTELGHSLFTNSIDAWNFGPVVSVVYSNYDKIVEAAINNGINGIDISPEEMDIIMDVWDQYKGLSAGELVNLTHEEGSPWSAVYVPGERNTHIPLELIEQYFSMPQNKLRSFSSKIDNMPTVDALPASEYDAEEDSVWEALLNETV